MLLRLFDEGEQGQTVAVEAEAGDDALAHGGQERLVAERLAAVDVADVNLDHGSRDGSDGISDGHRRVGVTPGIEHDAAIVKAHLLQAVHNLALNIALIDVYRVLRELLDEFLQVLVERAVAVHLGFTLAHEVQVGAVDDVDDHLIS